MRNLVCYIALAILTPTIVVAGVRCYEVEPYKNCNGWTHTQPNHYVSQSFTCTACSLAWASFFVGAANSGGVYVIEVQTLEGPCRGLDSLSVPAREPSTADRRAARQRQGVRAEDHAFGG